MWPLTVDEEVPELKAEPKDPLGNPIDIVFTVLFLLFLVSLLSKVVVVLWGMTVSVWKGLWQSIHTIFWSTLQFTVFSVLFYVMVVLVWKNISGHLGLDFMDPMIDNSGIVVRMRNVDTMGWISRLDYVWILRQTLGHFVPSKVINMTETFLGEWPGIH